ncbi:hypothetical protein N183_35690 [Sinorhizobium sp. Sb3]|uniref:NAD(P)/FAD-dependent oxidoreductase n=1 Tax=Sinorhizobium sp. Sb3 TaxID=1358417 RepID=UPI00071C5C5B|nr:NAD(P)/FAD-dependent oxidoreductase [Sinorhizobium sp. Sb3]KSV63396.1 hypothetical protein N183_35690 [Sinorhizobium sp. Sb3]
MTHDVIVIGAGPAGLSAAVTASHLGLKTLLVDEQSRAGGQIYRNVTEVSPRIAGILGGDYGYGHRLVQALEESDVDIRLATAVWDIASDLSVMALQGGGTLRFQAPQIIVATGAIERPSPLTGWTMPGVLNAGAAQIALKSGGSMPSGNIVLVGGGPLLLLVACQLLEAGASIRGVVETSPRSNIRRALPLFANALRMPRMLMKGHSMITRLKQARIPWFHAVEDVSIQGDQRAETLHFTSKGRKHQLKADVVLVHHGVIPNTQISRLLRVEHEWSDAQLAWRPRVDGFGETSVRGLRIAGDGAGIGGAICAEATGRLAAIGAAFALGGLTETARDQLSSESRRIIAAQARIRPFLDALYRPPDWVIAPRGDTIVCRCEEVSAADIREAVVLGSRGPNQTKFYNRCGMGPCQGRMCGASVTQIMADELSTHPADIGAYRVRAPLKPLRLGELAALSEADAKKEKSES